MIHSFGMGHKIGYERAQSNPLSILFEGLEKASERIFAEEISNGTAHRFPEEEFLKGIQSGLTHYFTFVNHTYTVPVVQSL